MMKMVPFDPGLLALRSLAAETSGRKTEEYALE